MIWTIIQVAAVLYALSVVFMAGGFVMDEMSFVNPRYGRAILYAVLWLPLLIYGRVVAPRYDKVS